MHYDDAEMRTLFERVLDRMLEAKWLRSYKFTKGKGYYRTWHVDGAEKVVLLRDWVALLGLEDNRTRVVLLYELCHGSNPPMAVDPEMVEDVLRPLKEARFALDARFQPGLDVEILWTPAGRDFCARFVAMVDELALRGDIDGLNALVQIARAWAPGPGTDIVFGSGD